MRDFILDLDRPRRLKFAFRACRLIREKFGDREINDLMNMKVDEMPAIAWAGLTWEEPDLTLEKTEELLDAAIPEKYTIAEIIETLSACLSAHFGMGKKTKGSAGEGMNESAKSPSGLVSPIEISTT